MTHLAEFDLAVHGEIEISATPQRIWPYLGRLREWKESVVALERIAGAPDRVGEVLRIGQRPGAQTVFVLQRTLGVEVPRWKIQTLVTEDGISTNGYVVHSLIPRGGHTLVTCSVAAKARVPAAVAESAGGIEQLARAINDSTQAKLDADHAALKRLVERS